MHDDKKEMPFGTETKKAKRKREKLQMKMELLQENLDRGPQQKNAAMMTQTGLDVIEELRIKDGNLLKKRLDRRHLEKLELVDDFNAIVEYGGNEQRFNTLMKLCEHAPKALARAKDKATSEDNSFSSLYYYSVGDETDEQREFLRRNNWLCMPYNLLHENKNDILDDVEIISVDSDGNIDLITQVKDENVTFDIKTAAWNVVEEDNEG